jgi:hypothetical protein
MLKNKFFVIFIIIFTILALAPNSIAGKKNKKSTFTKIIIDEAYHHLGDSYNPDFIIPDPEGTLWEKSFKLDKSIFKKNSMAFVKFYSHNIDFSFLIINGNRIRINKQNYDNSQIFYACIIPIPIEFLDSEDNIIGIESNAGDTGDFDDMEFGEVEIWFQ